MACPEVKLLEGNFTAGDLEDPIEVNWGEPLTGADTSELALEQPDGTIKIISGNLIDAATGTYEYPWSAGDLVEGERQLVKARLYRAGTRRKSTMYFKINVDADLT
jgi:hypothetical protein